MEDWIGLVLVMPVTRSPGMTSIAKWMTLPQLSGKLCIYTANSIPASFWIRSGIDFGESGGSDDDGVELRVI
jgi:hypothetical protein